MSATALPADDVAEAALAGLADTLRSRGYVVCDGLFEPAVVTAWFLYLKALGPDHFRRAGIGRGDERQLNRFVRGDEICWLDPGASEITAPWFAFAERLRRYLNRHLFLGLFDFECHFARYPEGGFYRRHYDAFRGAQRSRVVSIVFYLTPDWQSGDGGELVLYAEGGEELERVEPRAGRLVLFLSEEFPHEVLRTAKPRYSLTGWYRVAAEAPGSAPA